MIWVIRLAGLALTALGADALAFLVYQRAGAALDLRGCANLSAQSILTLDGLAMAALIAGGFLMAARLRPRL
jgi:hypothetical protein